MSRQLWSRGIWGIAVSVATSAVAIAALPQQQQGAGSDPQTQPRQLQNRTFDREDGNRGMAGRMNLDHLLLKVLIQANKDEIEMGKLAEQRSSNADVKQAATQMVQDHTRFLNQLEQFKGQPMQRGAAFRGPGQGGIEQNQQQQQQQQFPRQPQFQNQQNPQQPGTINQPGLRGGIAGEQGAARQERMAEGREHMMGEHVQFAKIMEQVDRNMQQSLVRELSSKQGADFDRCYLAGQLFGHTWVVEALKTFEQSASPQLKPILQEGLQTSEQHLTHIKSLLAKMDNEPRSNGQTQRRGRFQQRGRLSQ
jgi:predicted outer membrane protein